MAKPPASKPRPKLFHLTYILLFLPHFSGAPKSEGFCFQGERLLYGREPDGALQGGTGKAEDAKLAGAGISPNSAQRK